MSYADFSPTLRGQRLKLTVLYRTPALNLTKRQHWSAQYLEKKHAWGALLCALGDTESDHSIPIHLREVLKTSWTVLCTHIFSPMIPFGTSPSKPSKSKSGDSGKKKPKLKLLIRNKKGKGLGNDP